MSPKFTIWVKRGRDLAWTWYMSCSALTTTKDAFNTAVELHPHEDYPEYKAVLCKGEHSDRRSPYLLKGEDIIETYPSDLNLGF